MSFDRTWTADVLPAAPLIAPARQYVWPMRIAGEEDALARGALHVTVRPASGGSYLIIAALGFKDPSMPSGIHACPNPGQICLVAGGYAYLANSAHPEQVTLLAMKPVVSVLAAPDAKLLLFVGFHSILAWGVSGLAWETARLSWEGLRITSLEASVLHGFGWDLIKDAEVPFEVDLKTGTHRGGAYRLAKADHE